MSDSYWNRPPDLRSLPQNLRDQIKQISPLREGEVHAQVTLHNTKYKGTTMPTGRVWVEPYDEDREPYTKGILLSAYDPTGVNPLLAARLKLPQSLTFLRTVIAAYLRQGGTVEDIQDVINQYTTDPGGS